MKNKTALSRVETRREDDLSALNYFAGELNNFLTVSSLLEAGLRLFRDILQPDQFFYLEKQQDLMILKQQHPPLEDPQKFLVHDFKECLCGMAASTLGPVFSNDIDKDKRCTRKECAIQGLKSVAILPILLENKLFGLVGLALRSSRKLKDRQELLNGMARHLSLALSNVQYMEKYRLLIENQSEILVILDLSGVITFISPQIRLRYGLTQTQLQGDSFQNLVHPDDTASYQAALQELRKGNSIHIDLRIKSGQGYRWTSWSFTTQKDEKEQVLHYLGAGRNIEDQIQAEQSLRQEMELNSLIINHAGVGICVAHETGDSTIFGFTLWNSALSAMTGYSLEELQKIGWDQVLFPDTAERDKALLTMVELIRDGNIHAEWKVTTRYGELRDFYVTFRHLREQKEAKYYVGILRDITLQKDYESRLASEKEKLAVTLRSIGDGVITTDLEGKVTSMNRQAEIMTGWQGEDYLGRDLSEVFRIYDGSLDQPCENPALKVLKSGKIELLPQRTLLVDRQGNEKVIQDSGAPIRNAKSEIIGVVLVFQDMTEKQKLLDAAATNQKLESLGVLAGGIAHDFNNILAGLFGYIDLALNNQLEKSEAQDLQREALEVMERARGLTHQLLTFAKGGSPVKKVVDIASFLKKTVKFALSGSTVSCEYDISPELWYSEIDPNQLSQAVNNIVINAVHAMPKGGVMKVYASNLDEEQSKQNGLMPIKHVELRFTDCGIGIPQEILPSIFDPFFTTKPKGHGMGLTISHSIVRRHGGAIHADSKPGQGAVFSIYLPAEVKKKPSEESGEESLQTVTGKVLLMDDEEMILDIQSRILKSMGYTVDIARNGQEALVLFDRSIRDNHPYSAMFFDLTIPGAMGGCEAVKYIRKLDKTMPVFVCSGYASDDIMANPKPYGFTASLNKPFSREELTSLLKINKRRKK